MARAQVGMCFDRTFPAGAVAEFARRIEAEIPQMQMPQVAALAAR